MIKRLLRLLTLLMGCLLGWGLLFGALLHTLHAPWGGVYPADLAALADSVWVYLLATDPPVLMGHAQLNGNEERHLLDVKLLLQQTTRLLPLVGGLFVLGLWLGRGQYLHTLACLGKTGVLASLLLELATLLLGFKTSFAGLHRVFFYPIHGGLPVTPA